MSGPADSNDAPNEPPQSDGQGPTEPESALGLDDAWAELSPRGRAVVVGGAALLLLAAAVGIGFGLGGGSSDGDGTAVISETAGSVVTLEVPSTTEPDPLTETGPSTEGATPAPTDTSEGATIDEGTGDDAAAAEEPATGVRVFTDADGTEIGTVSIAEPSEVTWTSEGTTFVLVDEASGATLVDAVDAEGVLPLEVGEYNWRVEADAGWTITVRPR